MDPRPRSALSGLVGRQAEFEVLRSDLASATAGSGRLALLTGEAGIGKTRTATALAEEAREKGALVAWGRCHQAEGAPAYWPWLQALRALTAELPRSAQRELRSILELLQASASSEAHETAPEHARFELFGRVSSALAAATRDRPLVLVFDDIQWADVDSLRLLELVARELGSLRLLILATARDVTAPTRPVAPLLAALARPGRSLRLAGLTPKAVGELVLERLAHEPDAMTLERVHRITGGNPFFVIELVHLLANRATLSGQALPPAAREVLRERLAPLSIESIRLLEAASVIGQEFELDLLAVALDKSVETVLSALAEPLALGLVHAVPGTLRRHAFTHALVRETLYSDMKPGVRSAFHRVLARTLEAAGAARDDRLAALAHHFFESARTSDPSEAIRYGCEAGELAHRSLAYDEAIRYFEQVLAALKPGASASPDHERALLRATTGLGEALYGAGETDRAESMFRDAVSLARAQGPERFADTVLRWSLMRSEIGVPNALLNGLLEHSLSGLPEGASALRARVMARLSAGLHVQSGSERRRQELAEAALAMAHGLDDPETLGFVRARALVGLLGPDNLAQRLAATDEILRSAGVGENAALEALLLRIGDLTESAEASGLDQTFVALEQGVRASGRPFFAWSALVARSGRALLEGRFEAAETLMTEGLALGKQVEPQAAALRFVQQLYPLRAWNRRIDEIIPLVEQSVAQIAIPGWRAALAYAYDISGRRLEARRELDALAADDFAAIPRDATWLSAMALLANLCGRLEDRSRAEILRRLLLPYRDRIAVNRPLVIAVAPISMCLGVLAEVTGELDAADGHFAEALALSERMRALPWRAETLFHWSRSLVRRGERGDNERAGQLLQQAESAANAVGMPLLLDWIRELRSSAPRSARSADVRPCGRFRREGDVWTLVFEGRTTRVRDMVGMGYLAGLLSRPDQEMHVVDMSDGAHAAARGPDAITGAARGDAGDHLDARARGEYEARLREAVQDLEEAERMNDPGRRQRLNEEIDLLTSELSRGYGLGGRSRRAASTTERARISVSRAIKYAIDKIEAHDAALAEHLRRSVRTGAFCVYAPGRRERIDWAL